MHNIEDSYVAINKDLTIAVPDPDTIDRINRKYNYGAGDGDFLNRKNRYVYLYKIMYECVSDVEDAG